MSDVLGVEKPAGCVQFGSWHIARIKGTEFNPNLFPHIKHSKHQHWQQDMIMFQDFRPHRGTYHVLADSELTTGPDILASQSVRDSSKRK